HMAEKMPSSVKLGSRPIRSRMRWYSSGLRPWAATISGVMAGSLGRVMSAVRVAKGEGEAGKLQRLRPSVQQSGEDAPAILAAMGRLDEVFRVWHHAEHIRSEERR